MSPSATHWLVQRITMGLTEEELALADSLGYEGYLEYHLNHTAIDDSALDARLADLPTLTMAPYELVPINAGQARNELIEARILRAVYSKRQLFERMVEFWTDHFNIDIRNGTDQWLKTIDDRDVIRAHALGHFPDLLWASGHSAAMLYYLDNNTNVAGNPNENYARELLELHTMGVDGGFTQHDVEEVARCFTGWSLYGSNPTPIERAWTFWYRNNRHDQGTKVVLGRAIRSGGGISDGRIVLGMLAAHPSTARFIARKLCTRFWSYDPPQSLVDAVTATYTSTLGDIKAMLRTLFLSVDPLSAPPKYKRPLHLFASALRATGATITGTSALRTQLTAAGHLPFHWSPPDGYPDTLEAWVGLILPRWNFGASLMSGDISGSTVNVQALLGRATTADAAVDRIDAALTGGTLSADERSRIRDYVQSNPRSLTRQAEALGLAIASPSYQWY